MPNRALVMSGGGSKGAFELGAVSYLVNELKLDFQVIAGVSTGSLNASMLAQTGGVRISVCERSGRIHAGATTNRSSNCTANAAFAACH